MTPDRARAIQSLLDTRDAIPGLEVTELPPGEGMMMFTLECRLQDDLDETVPGELHE